MSVVEPIAWTEPARLSAAAPVVLDARVVTGTGGGPDKTILNSPRFLARSGYRMLCAYMHPPGDPGFEHLRRKAERSEAPLIAVEDRGAWDLRVARRLLDVCRDEHVAVWHGHDYKSNALGLLLRRFWPMRLVTTVHGWGKVGGRSELYYRIDRLCLRYYESVVCVSEDLLQQCLACGVPASRCELIENGIDTEEYARRQTTAEAKRRLGLPAGRLHVGAVGRLSEEKGFDVLIRAVDRLLKEGLDVELLLVGEGEDRARLERLALDLGRQDRVRLLGYQPDARSVYEAMDVFALSSLREGLPNVLLEAMALEVPAVATRIAGVPRVVEHGANGRLVEPGQEEALAGELSGLLRDADARARLGRAGRETVEQRYSFANRMDRIRQLYDVLLGRAGDTSFGVSS